jgi:succinate dehydrogenase/fumarate reductase cytochrome b subunit
MSARASMDKRVTGVVLSAVIFIALTLIDIVYFPGVETSFGYPTYELIAYGSWFVVLLLILGILAVTGNIPERKPREDEV